MTTPAATPPSGAEPEPPRRGLPAGSPANSFAAVCEAHFDFVWRFAAFRGVESSALPHIVHKVFGVLHGRLISLQEPAELRVSVASITRNVVRGYLRQLGGHSPLEAAALSAPDRLPALAGMEQLERRTSAELCELILAKMTDTEREVFLLCEVEGFSLFETAEALHIGESTLRERLADACKIFNVATAELRAQKFWMTRNPDTRS